VLALYHYYRWWCPRYVSVRVPPPVMTVMTVTVTVNADAISIIITVRDELSIFGEMSSSQSLFYCHLQEAVRHRHSSSVVYYHQQRLPVEALWGLCQSN
jgi:hypothetical protein